ncbi:hypothetical protein ABIA24_002077 [Sinorhizobium fredii]
MGDFHQGVIFDQRGNDGAQPTFVDQTPQGVASVCLDLKALHEFAKPDPPVDIQQKFAGLSNVIFVPRPACE